MKNTRRKYKPRNAFKRHIFEISVFVCIMLVRVRMTRAIFNSFSRIGTKIRAYHPAGKYAFHDAQENNDYFTEMGSSLALSGFTGFRSPLASIFFPALSVPVAFKIIIPFGSRFGT